MINLLIAVSASLECDNVFDQRTRIHFNDADRCLQVQDSLFVAIQEQVMSGGAIYVGPQVSTALIFDCAFSRCTTDKAGRGGAISAGADISLIDRCCGHQCQSNFGQFLLLSNSSGSIVFNTSTMLECSYNNGFDSSQGCVIVDNEPGPSPIILSLLNFTQCWSHDGGSAVSVWGTSPIQCSFLTVVSCTEITVIDPQGSTTSTVVTCNFYENSLSWSQAGVLHVRNGAILQVTRCIFSGNSLDFSQGGSGSIVVTDCVFSRTNRSGGFLTVQSNNLWGTSTPSHAFAQRNTPLCPPTPRRTPPPSPTPSQTPLATRTPFASDTSRFSGTSAVPLSVQFVKTAPYRVSPERFASLGFAQSRKLFRSPTFHAISRFLKSDSFSLSELPLFSLDLRSSNEVLPSQQAQETAQLFASGRLLLSSLLTFSIIPGNSPEFSPSQQAQETAPVFASGRLLASRLLAFSIIPRNSNEVLPSRQAQETAQLFASGRLLVSFPPRSGQFSGTKTSWAAFGSDSSVIFTLSNSLTELPVFPLATLTSVKNSIPDDNAGATSIRSSSLWFIIGAVAVVVILGIVVAVYLIWRHSHQKTASAVEADTAMSSFTMLSETENDVLSLYGMTLDGEDNAQMADVRSDTLWDAGME
jgi:hypothetical protein